MKKVFLLTFFLCLLSPVQTKAQQKPSNALFTQIDLMASFAKMLNEKLPENQFADSRDFFNTMIGKENTSRDFIIEQPENRALAIVKDGWKYITPCHGPALLKAVNIESGYSKEDQLYNLKDDPQELDNLALKYPEKLLELKNFLKKTEDSYKLNLYETFQVFKT